jgi:hypothetical protein
MRQEFALHVSVVSLKRFALPRHPGKSEDVEALKARLEAVGNKLAEPDAEGIMPQSASHFSPKASLVISVILRKAVGFRAHCNRQQSWLNLL